MVDSEQQLGAVHSILFKMGSISIHCTECKAHLRFGAFHMFGAYLTNLTLPFSTYIKLKISEFYQDETCNLMKKNKMCKELGPYKTCKELC